MRPLPGKSSRGAALRFGGLAIATLFVGYASMAPATDAPTGGPPGVRTFLLTNTSPGMPDEPGVCQPLAEGGLDIFFKSLSPEEQAKYPFAGLKALQGLMNERLGYKSVRLEKAMPEIVPIVRDHGEAALPPEQAALVADLRRRAGAPPGKGMINDAGRHFAYDSCTNPEDFPYGIERFKPYDGKQALGINLDGKVDGDDFVSPKGEKGIDNQLWRATGCIKVFREQADPKALKAGFSSAQAPTLVEISKLDSIKDDPEVEVRVYVSSNPVATDARGGALQRATYDIDPNPRLQSRTRGRIVGGVLTTDPFDVVLGRKAQILDTVQDLRQARLQATLNPDGTIEGGIYGYYTVESFWEMLRQFTQNGADQTQISCPGLRAAVEKFADGVPDPKTGRFTALSSAVNFVGVPAYAMKRQGAGQVAHSERGAR
jgi:hypothetical protein